MIKTLINFNYQLSLIFTNAQSQKLNTYSYKCMLRSELHISDPIIMH